MKKVLSSLCLSLSCLLSACSSSDMALLDTQTNSFFGGQRDGDTVSYFWYTETNKQPAEISEYVTSGDGAWYQSAYRWEDGSIKEIKREGKVRKDGQLVPFSTHLRYNSDGEAVYQVYSVDGTVLPLDADVLKHYLQHGQTITDLMKQQEKSGVSMIQGFWNGARFESCDGKEYTSVEFDQTLPSLVVRRLAGMDNYLAVIGKTHKNTIHVQQLLVLDDDDHECIDKPDLIKESK